MQSLLPHPQRLASLSSPPLHPSTSSVTRARTEGTDAPLDAAKHRPTHFPSSHLCTEREGETRRERDRGANMPHVQIIIEDINASSRAGKTSPTSCHQDRQLHNYPARAFWSVQAGHLSHRVENVPRRHDETTVWAIKISSSTTFFFLSYTRTHKNTLTQLAW